MPRTKAALIPADDSLPSGEFLIEDHIADAMPSAHWHDHVEINYLPQGRMDYLMNGRRVTTCSISVVPS